jgi:hypothetical protein
MLSLLGHPHTPMGALQSQLPAGGGGEGLSWKTTHKYALGLALYGGRLPADGSVDCVIR